MLAHPAQPDGRVLRAKALREERRAQILKAARTVFAEKGYESGSISDIIDTAGIARGTFYLHFESKRAVFGEILDVLLADLNEVITRVDIDSEVTPMEQLITNVTRVLDVLIANLDVTRILVRNVGGDDAEFSQRLTEFYDHCLELIRSSVESGIEMRLVRNIDVDVVASCVLGSIKETVEQMLLRKSPDELDKRGLAEKLLDYNLYGLLAT